MANFFDWLDAKKIPFSRTPGGQTLISDDLEDALDLENSLITTLPHNLWVGGYLNLRGTAISSLPEDWYVEGPLLLDVEKIASPLAWRYIKLADLNADDHLMGDYCLDTSYVGDFFDKADEEFVEIFAVWVSGEIRVYAGRHYGIPQKFMRDDTSDTFQQVIRDCVAELEERLSTDWH